MTEVQFPLPPAPDQPLALLGGLTPAQFMRRHWQKKPLLVKGAGIPFHPGAEKFYKEAGLLK